MPDIEIDYNIIIMGGFICVLIALGYHIVYRILKSPFSYPYFNWEFDVSGKREPHIDDLIDEYLISDGFEDIQNHQRIIDQWKQDSCQKLEHSILKI